MSSWVSSSESDSMVVGAFVTEIDKAETTESVSCVHFKINIASKTLLCLVKEIFMFAISDRAISYACKSLANQLS